MKRVALALAIISYSDYRASAGVVSFFPNETEIVLGVDDSIVELDISLTSVELANQLRALDVVLGSHDGLQLIDFEWSPIADAIMGAVFCDPLPCIRPIGVYPSDIEFVIIPILSAIPLSLPMSLGTLRIDTAGLSAGSYEVVVDSDFDQRSVFWDGVAPAEGLFGLGTINIVPEPTTYSLLGLTLVGLVRRRRRARLRATQAAAYRPARRGRR